MSKISIPSPKVSDTSSATKRPPRVKKVPVAASKKVPIVASETKQSKPIQQRSTKVKKPKQPVAPQQAKQVKAIPPATSKKAPIVKGKVKQSVPPQPKGKKSKKKKQPKQPNVPQQVKQANLVPPKIPAKATPAPVAVPKIVNVPKNTSLEGKDELDLGSMPLDQLKEKLKQLTKEVLADPSHEEFNPYFAYEKADWEALFNWFEHETGDLHSYLQLLLMNWDRRDPSQIEKQKCLDYRQIELFNNAKPDQVVRAFPVHFFGRTLDEKLMSPDNVYNLLARSGLQSDHFQKGRFGFTEKVFCKSIQLEHDESVEAAQNELRAKIDEELVKVGNKTKTRDINYQYVVLVFQLPKRNDLPFYQINIRDARSPNYARDNLLMAQIHDTSERRIYVCLKNEARLVIDLHEHSVPEALDKVEDFINIKWKRYEESCEIITGVGNHSARGFSILKKEVSAFLKSPDMLPYVQKIEPLRDYGYKVWLKKPKLCDLTKLAPNQDPVEVAKTALAEAALTDNPRVRFLANNINSVWPRLHIKGVYMSFDFHGENELRVEIKEPSEELLKMSKISIPSPKVSDTSSPQKKAHQAKTAPAAASKKAPAVGAEAQQPKPIRQRSAKVKKSKQPVAPPQVKQMNAVPPTTSKKVPVKGEDKQSGPPQPKGKKTKQAKQPKVPQQVKQANPAPPKAPAKATPVPVAVPKTSDVPKLNVPAAAKKQPSAVKSAPPATSKKVPVVQGEVKQSAPPQQKGKKTKKKRPKRPAAPQQVKQANPAPPKASAKTTPTPVAVPKIVNVPKNTSLEGKDELDLGFMPLDQLQEKLKQLTQEVLADPSHESFMLYFSVHKSEWDDFFNWYKPFGDREFSYPYSITLASYPSELLPEKPEEDRLYKAIRVRNNTKRENDAKTFPRRFFDGQFDEKLINPDTLYNLLARSGLQPEHFQKGRFGFTEKVFCKSIQLENDESVEATQNELRAKIDEELVKVGKKTDTRDINYQYVVLVFQLPKREDLPYYQIEVHDARNPNYARENSIIGQIDHNSERRIYICLQNDSRLVIDLHEHSVPEALDKVEDFVITKWERYEESCEIITGAGIHSVVKGKSVLQQNIKPLLESKKMSVYVSRIEPLIGNTEKNPLVYAFRVFLKPPKLCDLTKLAPGQDPVKVAISAIEDAVSAGETRIRFIANNINSVWPRLYIKDVYMSFDFHGENEFRVEIQKPSEESESAEEVQE